LADGEGKVEERVRAEGKARVRVKTMTG